MMNGKQRARWCADVISDVQRLRKHARGRADGVILDVALSKLADARLAALADHDEGVCGERTDRGD